LSRLENIWFTLTQSSEVLSVEHCFGPEGVVIHAVEVKKSRKELLKQGFFQAASPKVLSTLKKPELPVVLSITGRKVLSRKVETKAEEIPLETIRRAFPNMDVRGLHVERYQMESVTVVSAIREEMLEEVLEGYRAEGYSVIGFTLGVYPLFPLVEQFDLYHQQLGYLRFNGETKEVSIEDALSEEKVSIADERMPNVEAIPYLSGLSYLLAGAELSEDIPLAVLHQSGDWRFKVAYKQLMTFGGICLLVFLMISFFTFSSYYDQNQQLKSRTAGALHAVEDLKALQDQVNAKETFLANNASGNRVLSEMCDKIGATVPSAVALEQMVIFPLVKEHKRERLFEFGRNELELTGACARYAAFQLWMENLNALPFVEKIEILGFGDADRSAPEKFHLRLSLRI
jgi:hypothetical protein